MLPGNFNFGAQAQGPSPESFIKGVSNVGAQAQAASSGLGEVASAGGGFLASLAAPGVGTAIAVGAQLLGSLFGGGDDAELAAFQAEVQRQEGDKNRATRTADESRKNVLNSFSQGIQAQNLNVNNTLSAIDRFLR